MTKAFVTTVFNEEDSIEVLFKSLLNQTKIPDEIIVVDAGSTDNTIRRIKKCKKWFKKVSFKIFVKNGNRSTGRNHAVKNAKSEIIAVSDAGCSLEKDWFEKITKALDNPKIDVVAGFYLPITHNVFQVCLATYTCVPKDKITKDFLPSSRSIAFKKSVWESVGGYPEYLDTCEDLVFAKNLKRCGMNFSLESRAIVWWPQRENFIEAAKQFFAYAKGDGEALYIRSQTPLLFLRYITGFVILFITLNTANIILVNIVLILIALYLSWSIIKNYKYVNNWRAIFILPTLQILSDFAVITGMTFGFILLKLRIVKL